jgi:hypothetical protein
VNTRVIDIVNQRNPDHQGCDENLFRLSQIMLFQNLGTEQEQELTRGRHRILIVYLLYL